MNAKIPQTTRESYIRHRREMTRQIILPIVLTTFLVIAVIVLVYQATFNNGGDVGRWAAISTIWIVLPIMLGMVIFLVILIGLIYLLAKLTSITPKYTGMAQGYVHKAAIYIKRAADAAVKPVVQINGLLASITTFFERMKP